MYLVVIVNGHYPSVLHFSDKLEAIEKYEEHKESGYVVHLSKVETSNFNTDVFEFEYGELNKYINDVENIPEKLLDVEWYL